MLPRYFSSKLRERVRELKLTPKDFLGLKKTKIVFYPFITSKGLQDIRKVFIQTPEEDEELI